MQFPSLKITNTNGQKVGTLTIMGSKGGPVFGWSYVGTVLGQQQGQGMWMWDAQANRYWADLYDADPATGSVVAEMQGSWFQPAAGSAPSIPWFRPGDWDDLILIDQTGTRKTYNWWKT